MDVDVDDDVVVGGCVVEVRVTTRSEGDEDKNKQGNLDININFEIRFLLGEEWRCQDS